MEGGKKVSKEERRGKKEAMNNGRKPINQVRKEGRKKGK